MELIDTLLRDHEKLRRGVSGMGALLCAEECSGMRRIGPEVARRLAEMEGRLTADLNAHEALEERFVAEALKDAGGEGESLLQVLRSDHKSIREVFRVLSVLTSLGEGVSAYSVRFAVSSLAHALERHLECEEKKAFPLIRRSHDRPVSAPLRR